MSWRQTPLDRGVVIGSVVIFTTGGPVTTVEYRSLILGGNRNLQVQKEVVLLKDDEIEVFAPPTVAWVPLTSLATFSLVKAYIYETYGVDVEKVSVRMIEELELRVVRFFVLIRGLPSINPRRIYDITREIDYDNL
jgi:hypothetical protein